MTTSVFDRVYPIEVVPDVYRDGRPCWLARHPDLPGCAISIDTREEAEAALADARHVYLEYLVENDLPIPEPTPEQALARSVTTVPLSKTKVFYWVTEFGGRALTPSHSTPAVQVTTA